MLRGFKRTTSANRFFFDVFLVDDGSTDGTFEKVKTTFPEINLIKGNGNLYWNRGMYTAWQQASENYDYDYYLWLNDDTHLYKNAFKELFDTLRKVNNESIIVGFTCSPTNKNIITYGGRINDKLLNTNGKIIQCDEFNGNCVLIPRVVFKTVGNLDPFFSHSFGDVEYGMRSKKAGFTSFVTATAVGECERNAWPPKHLNPNIGILERFKFLYSPLGFHPKESYYLNSKHKNLFYALLVICKLHLNVIWPNIVKQ